MDVLIHISQQLNNSTIPAFEQTAFQVSSNVVAVNMLFFLSLALVLIDAFLAMLVKGWLQEFDGGWRKHTLPHLRAQERERRLRELKRWRLDDLVALLPILIQLSLLLFSIGIIALIFPLHLPSAIMCFVTFVAAFDFYIVTTGLSIVNDYAPFSSLVSRLFARGFAMLRRFIVRLRRFIASAISFHNRPSPTTGYQGDTDTPDETTPLYNRVAERAQSHNPGSVEKSNTLSHSDSVLDPQIHADVVEQLVTTTVEAVENIPIFLELFDQPVKYPTVLRPRNVEKWKKLLNTTLSLPRDQFTFSVSAACTLARTMMICHNHENPDKQLFHILQHHLGSGDADDQRRRTPLNLLFSSYLPYWLGYSDSGDLWRRIAFLEPSDAADNELLWMVNTFHRTMRFVGDPAVGWETGPENRLDTYLGFFAAVLTYVSSTEQSRRSNVQLTAAAIYALHAIRSAIEQGGILSIDRLFILQLDDSTSEPVPTTFCQVGGVVTLDLWSDECVQFVRDILQWSWKPYMLNDFRLSLIASLYIDSTKQAQAHTKFEALLKDTSIEDVSFKFSSAFDGGNLAIYSYIALTQKPLPWNPDPLSVLHVIKYTISEYSTLQLSGLQILEIAVKHADKIAGSSPDWLRTVPSGLEMTLPGDSTRSAFIQIDHWILLHLGTLLYPRSYLPQEDVEDLEWSDTPETVHIARVRLDLYDSLANAEHKGHKVPKPDPKLLREFLWSNDHDVCTRAFNWCLDLVPTSQTRAHQGEADEAVAMERRKAQEQGDYRSRESRTQKAKAGEKSGPSGEANNARMFIPEKMGREWIIQFIHVLCQSEHGRRTASWECLISHLEPKWAMLPSSWCHEFASAFLFTMVNSVDTSWLPAYQVFAQSHAHIPPDQLQAFLPFLATLLKLVESSLTPDSIISLENWLAKLPQRLENQNALTRMKGILVAKMR